MAMMGIRREEGSGELGAKPNQSADERWQTRSGPTTARGSDRHLLLQRREVPFLTKRR